jgi:uncharacterized protein YecT (DUF1311 family)
LYYTKRAQAGTTPAEWKQVRECAVANGNNAVLMMLYANGFGVQRDTDRAIHYACSLDFIAKAEMEGRIKHLAHGLGNGKPFDQCDDITSGYMGTICAGIQQSQDERSRNSRLDRMRSTLPVASRSAFAKLHAAAERYAEAGAGETDMRGTAAPGFAVELQGRLRKEFAQAALGAVKGKLPASSPAEFAQLDSELNRLYQSVMTAPSTQDGWPDRIGDSTISHTDVRAAERLWLAYRNAFVAFQQTLPSGSDPTAIKTLLTSQRIAQLTDVARYR